MAPGRLLLDFLPANLVTLLSQSRFHVGQKTESNRQHQLHPRSCTPRSLFPSLPRRRALPGEKRSLGPGAIQRNNHPPPHQRGLDVAADSANPLRSPVPQKYSFKAICPCRSLLDPVIRPAVPAFTVMLGSLNCGVLNRL